MSSPRARKQGNAETAVPHSDDQFGQPRIALRFAGALGRCRHVAWLPSILFRSHAAEAFEPLVKAPGRPCGATDESIDGRLGTWLASEQCQFRSVDPRNLFSTMLVQTAITQRTDTHTSLWIKRCCSTGSHTPHNRGISFPHPPLISLSLLIHQIH